MIIDAAIPQYSYPDMVTQTIHVGDCELLEHFMDVTDGANPKWSTWTNRTWLEGMNASATRPNPYRGGLPGNTECINGWRGLTPLALNPLFGSAGAGSEFYNPAVIAAIKWTHWDDLRNVYGVDADGYAKVPWDNVGVQYGLSALKSGNITPAEFLKLNATVGTWKEGKDMVQEGCPFIAALCSNPAQFDPWSRRNMQLSPDGGVTPAARREGNMDAANAAYTSGIVFRGAIDIPIIDWRHYLEAELDMHNSHQSFASRKRMLNLDGDASNQVIWFTDARPARASDQTPLAFQVMDEWMANIRANPDSSVAANKPAAAVDSCFATNGSLMASGADVWAGILDSRPAGACTTAFPTFSTTRIVAGGPIEGGVFKCARKPVATALDRRHVCAVGADRRRRDAARADLPDGGLRLLEAGRRPAGRLLDGLFRVVASRGHPGHPKTPELSAEPGRATAPALARRLENVDDADERRAVAQLVPAHVEPHPKTARDGHSRGAVDPLADTGHRRQRAAHPLDRPDAVQVHGTRVPHRAELPRLRSVRPTRILQSRA